MPSSRTPRPRGMRTTQVVRRARRLITAGAALALGAGLVGAVAVPARAAGPAITLDKQAPASVLAGATVEYALTASNPTSPDAVPEYNLSLSDVLPDGLVYVPGSTEPAGAGEPTVTTHPVTGQQVLVWSNIADLQVGASTTLRFRATVDPADVVGSLLVNEATALTQRDPRLVPRFTSAGAPVAGTYDESATASAVTRVSAITIDKSEPSPEGELLRGVHEHTTVYTLTVTNNDVSPTNDVQVVDYIPAGLEFLGCGGIDNTPGGAVEYPGAPRLTGTPLVAGCVEPDLVETVSNPAPVGGVPLPAGVYTKVTWTSASIPGLTAMTAGDTVTIPYAAGIPLRANTMTWPGGTPTAASGGQAANLDNNSGASTRETLSERTWTNIAHVTGTYTGATTTGVAAVEDTASESVVAEDLRILKSVTPTTFEREGVATYTLTLATSEYTSSADIVITDVVPDGLCPLSDTANFSPTSDPACAPSGAFAPSQRIASYVIDGNGTTAITFDPIVSMDPSTQTTVTFKARMLGAYTGIGRDGMPTVAGDTFTNRVSLFGETTPIAGTGETGVVTVADASSATQTSQGPALTKQMKPRDLDPDCTVVTDYAVPNPAQAQWTFRKGDTLCFKVRVDFPSTIRTRNPVITDFLPYDTEYIPGSMQLTAANTAANVQFNEVAAASGAPPTWTAGSSSGGVLYEAPGAVFEAVLAVRVTEAATPPVPDLVGNLLKMRTEDTEGRAQSYRQQVDFNVAPAANVTITKGVAQVDGAPVPPNGPNVDGVTVRQGQTVRYRTDVTNAGRAGFPGADFTVRGINVWDVLPAGITCAMVDPTSYTFQRTGGSEIALPAGIAQCTDPGDPAQPTFAERATNSAIAWRFPSPDATAVYRLATSQVMTLMYEVTLPTQIGVSTSLVNTAYVRSFDSYTNRTGITTTYYPASNIDTTVPVDLQDAQEARDPSNVVTPNATLDKTVATAITESNNNTPTQATIGEFLGYTVSLRIPAGTSVYNAVLTDPMPTGITLVTANAGFSSTNSGPATGVLPTGVTFDPATATLTFPAVYNNTDATDHLFEVSISALVNNTTGTNTHGRVRTNTSTFLSDTTETSGTRLPARTASSSITIVLASPTLAKTASPIEALGGQVVTFRLTAANTSGRPPSHDTVVVDCLPAEFTFISGTPPTGTSLGAPVAGDDTNGCAVGTTRITWTVGTLLAGTANRKVLPYTAQLTPLAVGGSTLTNTATLTGSSINGVSPDEATFTRSASATVTVSGQTVVKGVAPQSATIGETVTYSVTDTIPENTAYYAAAITDSLPSGIDPASVTTVSAVCVEVDLDPCSGLDPAFGTDLPTSVPSVVGWLLGDIPSLPQKRFVTVTYTAVVRDTGGPFAGNDLDNSARGRWSTAAATPYPASVQDALTLPAQTAEAVATLHIVEPVVMPAKSVTDPFPSPAETFTYIVTTTVGSAPAGDRSPAYDITIVDTIPTEIVIDAATISDGGVYDPTARTITWDPTSTPALAGPVALGEVFTFTYDATLADSALLIGASITNTVMVPTYYSLAATEAGRREYSAGPATASVLPDFPVVTLDKTAQTPNLAFIGQPFEWTLTLSNSSTAGATDVTVNDILPVNWEYVDDSARVSIGGVTTAVEPIISFFPQQQALTWAAIGDLAVGDTASITFTAVPTPGAVTNPGVGTTVPHTNTANATWQDDGGYARPGYSTPAETATAVIPAADLAIQKFYFPTAPLVGDEAMAGQTVEWVLSVNNLGPDTAYGPFRVTDVLPDGLEYVAATGTDWSCVLQGDDVTLICESSQDSLAPFLALPAITVLMRVPADTPAGTQFDNVALVESSSFDPDESNNIDNNRVVSTAEADLQLVKSQPGQYVVGGEVTYSIRVANLGPSASAMPLVVTDSLPAGLTIVDVDGGTFWQCTPETGPSDSLECLAQEILIPGRLEVITVTVRVDAPPGTPTADNTATVTPTTPDPDPTNNTDTVTDTVVDDVDLEIVKTTTGANPAVAGGSTRFQIAVNNAGPASALGVRVVDTLDPGLAATSASGTGWTCVISNAGLTVTCDRDTLAQWETATIVVDADVSAAVTNGSTVSNTAVVTSSSPDTGTRPDSDGSDVLVAAEVDLELTKSIVGPATTFVPGDLIDFSFGVRNLGPSYAAGPIVITDTLPAGLEFVSALPVDVSGWDCVAAGGIIRCELSATGSVAPGWQCSTCFTIRVAVQADGSAADYLNTATVSSPTPETTDANNTDTAQVNVTQQADLAVVKSHSGSPKVGEVSSFTIAVSNLGPSTARDVVVRDVLPRGLTFVSATGRGWTCSATGQVVTCQRATALPGGSEASPITLRVRVGPEAFSTVTNIARVSTSTPESSTRNNTSRDRVAVQRGDQRVPGKSRWPREIVPGKPETIVPGRPETNVGTKITTRIECVPMLRARVPAGDGNFCTVTYGPGGRAVVTTNGPYPLAVTVRVTAPAVRGYRAFQEAREYVVRG